MDEQAAKSEFRPRGVTRRELIRGVAATAPAWAFLPSLSRSEDVISLESEEDFVPPVGVLRIVLHPPVGRDLPSGLRVGVKIDGRWVELPRTDLRHVYEGPVATGKSYGIQINADGHITIERDVAVNESLAVVRVYLIPQGWPSYYVGGIEVPFEPRPRFAGVAVSKRLSDAEVADLATRAAAAGFMQLTVDQATREPLESVNNSVMYFEPRDNAVKFFSFEPDPSLSHDRVPPAAVNQLRAIFAAHGGRVGSPAQTSLGTVRIVDSQFLMRFPSAIADTEARRFAESIDASVIQATDQANGVWLIEFDDPQHLGRHLAVVASMVKSGQLLSGEPNLLFQLQAHSPQNGLNSIVTYIRMFLCQTAPLNDPFVSCQDNLSRQRVKEAWCFLEDIDAELRFGSSSICVATIDTGIMFNSISRISSHPDVNSERLKYCFDVERNQPCTENPALVDEKIHGMASYGIISGKPNNTFGISGIAPNTTHVALQFTGVIQSSKSYAETLEWVAGIRETAPSIASNAPLPIPAADVISCSHGFDGGLVPDSIKIALRKVTCKGRGGRGTVIVYSAGNEDCYIEDKESLPTFPNTIGVANTEVRNGVESRWQKPRLGGGRRTGSNFGPYVDLCANGQWAPSLEPGAVVGDPVCGTAPNAGAGVYLYEGTSAAAAIVSGAAALVLAVNPDLNWMQVRSILCASAEKIDCANVLAVTDCIDKEKQRLGRWDWKSSSQRPAMPAVCTELPKGMKWFSDFYGYGRLDVLEAVKLAHAIEGIPQPSCQI